MEAQTVGIKCLKFNGYKIELGTNMRNEKPNATLYKFITVGKNKGTYKRIEGFYFSNEQRREEWITKQIKSVKDYANSQLQKNDARKAVQANFVNPYSVGDIFYESWGYDQTNIDFYMIVEVKNKSVMMQSIGGNLIREGGYGMDAGRVTPDINNKIGLPFLKPIQVRVDNDNNPIYRIASRHGSFSKYDKGDKGCYCSWGR